MEDKAGHPYAAASALELSKQPRPFSTHRGARRDSESSREILEVGFVVFIARQGHLRLPARHTRPNSLAYPLRARGHKSGSVSIAVVRGWVQDSALRLRRAGRAILTLRRARQICQTNRDNVTLTEEPDVIARAFAKFLRFVSSSLSPGKDTSDFHPGTPDPILLLFCCGLAGTGLAASASVLGCLTTRCGTLNGKEQEQWAMQLTCRFASFPASSLIAS